MNGSSPSPLLQTWHQSATVIVVVWERDVYVTPTNWGKPPQRAAVAGRSAVIRSLSIVHSQNSIDLSRHSYLVNWHIKNPQMVTLSPYRDAAWLSLTHPRCHPIHPQFIGNGGRYPCHPFHSCSHRCVYCTRRPTRYDSLETVESDQWSVKEVRSRLVFGSDNTSLSIIHLKDRIPNNTKERNRPKDQHFSCIKKMSSNHASSKCSCLRIAVLPVHFSI